MHSAIISLVTILSISIRQVHAQDAVGGIPTRRQTACPSVWTDIASDLKTTFVSDDGTCTDSARAAIRLSFHDCFPAACDGSIILANECTERGENAQMVDICASIGSQATQYNVSTADLIQFAAAFGIAACPGGPMISFKVGRTDSTTANPTGQLPGARSNATALIAAFAAKGFTTTELVALVGAHTAAKNLADVALDSTVGQWDNTFYADTADSTAPASLDSDRFLSNSSETSSTWSGFAANSQSWQDAFVPAMEKMSLLGNDEASLVDCSGVIQDMFSSAATQNAIKAVNNGTAESLGFTTSPLYSRAMSAWIMGFLALYLIFPN